MASGDGSAAAPGRGRGRASLLSRIREVVASSSTTAATLQGDPGGQRPLTGAPTQQAVAAVVPCRPKGVSGSVASQSGSGFSDSATSFGSSEFDTSSKKAAAAAEYPRGGHQAVVSQMGRMSLGEPALPRDSSGPVIYRGSVGQPVPMAANFLRMKVIEGCGVFEHEVLFSPEVDSVVVRRRLVRKVLSGCSQQAAEHQQQEQQSGDGPKPQLQQAYSFDGRKLFTARPVRGDAGGGPLTVLVTADNVVIAGGDEAGAGGLGPVRVTVVYKRQRLPGDPDIITLYNGILKGVMRALELVQFKQSCYDPNLKRLIPQHKVELWPGFVTAIDVYEGGLMMQCDVSHRILRTETALELLMGIRRRCEQTNNMGALQKEVNSAFVNASVMTTYNNRVMIVDDVDFKQTPLDTFSTGRGDTITYMEYYETHYGIKIKNTKQPLLIHRPKKIDSGGKEEPKNICLVPELCKMTGLSDAMRNDFRVMKDIGESTKPNPEERQRTIQGFVQRVNSNEKARKLLADWGLQFDTDLIKLNGRQLPPVQIVFSGGYTENIGGPRADWTRSATTRPVLTPVNLDHWSIIYPLESDKIMKEFFQMMKEQGPRMGIRMAPPQIIKLTNLSVENYVTELSKVINPNLQLVMVIFSQANKPNYYSAVKSMCIVTKPVISQVVCLKTISNSNPNKLRSVVQKILLQVNVKLGGELWALRSSFKNVMVVGVDVYHDKLKKNGSVASVVMSLNDNMSHYYSQAVVHREGQELIDVLKDAFSAGLAKYWESNNRWPAHVVVFRDGVGDGQLEVVQKHESEQFVVALREMTKSAAAAFSKGSGGASSGPIAPAMPGFTFVVVQKRINARLFTASGPGGKVMRNPDPGCLIDHTITRYKYKDFFLVPQSVNQGTVNPTHFVVLRELGEEMEAVAGSPPLSKMNASQVQQLAYQLTFMYFNWTGTVRVPAPVQYAHKLADLIGQYVRKTPPAHLNDRLYYL